MHFLCNSLKISNDANKISDILFSISDMQPQKPLFWQNCTLKRPEHTPLEVEHKE